MRVSDSHRLLFVHIPKTAGGTVEKILDRNLPDVWGESRYRHDTLAQILERDPYLGGYWVFGFVRNPWARMVSWWAMISRSARKADEGSAIHVAKFEKYEIWATVRGWDFDTFITRGPDEFQRLRTTQVEALTAAGRSADFVGRTESFADDVNVVRRHIGLRPKRKLPHSHRGDYGSYRDFYTPTTRDRVGQLFKADIDEFGYAF